jgi:hypothetical protein
MFGFNRAKHAVLEAAILATRKHILPPADIEAEFRKFAIIIAKTGGPQEKAAFEALCAACGIASVPQPAEGKS